MVSTVLKGNTTIPGPRGLPFLGVTLQMLAKPLTYQEELVEKYGRINRLPFAGTDIVMLHDADAILELLRQKSDSVTKGETGMAAVAPLLGQGVATLTDPEKWQFAHDTILPLFTPKMLMQYFDVMLATVKEEMQTIDAYANSGKDFDLYTFMHEGIFKVLINSIIQGIDEKEISEWVHLFDQQSVYIGARYLTNSASWIEIIPAVRRGKAALEELNRRVEKLILARQAQLAEENIEEARDMLDALLLAKRDDGSPLDYKEVRDNVMTMLFGGHETTAGSTTWAFGLLAANEDKRLALVEEIDRVVGDNELNYHMIKELDYTRMALDESMRLYPMFPWLFRTPLKDIQIGGYDIKAGEQIAFTAHTTHRDPRYWPEPEKFQPERHTKEGQRSRPRTAFLPFAFGERRCIGERVGRLEASLFMIMLHQKYQFKLSNGQLPKAKASVSIKPKGGMLMTVSHRT